MATFDSHANFAYSTVATAPSPATSGTSLTVQTGDGANFPATPFNATVWPSGARPISSNAEIVRVTAISTDTFTITRAQESSTAQSITTGYQIAASITKKTVTDIEGLFPSGSVVGTSDTQTLTNKTLTTPSISNLSNSTFKVNSNPVWQYLGYAQITSNFTTTNTSATQVTGLTVTVTIPTGTTKARVTGYTGSLGNVSGANGCILTLWDGTVGSGTQIGQYNMIPSSSGTSNVGATAVAVYAASAGSHTYNIGLASNSSGTSQVGAGVSQPSYILVECC